MANTPPILPPLLPVSPAPVVVGQQQNPPPLPQLPAGAILQGMVSGQDANGNMLIKTDTLQLVLSTHYPLAKGAQVAVRLDQALSKQLDKNALPQLRIIAIDGKPPPPVTAQPAASQTQQSQMLPHTSPQASQAKPIGVLLDIISRPDATTVKAAATKASGDAATPPATTRGTAAEVNLSEGTKAAAVLLRPAVSQKATALLTQLAQAIPSMPQAAQPALANALRPGLQLQVQVVQTTAAPAASPDVSGTTSSSSAPAQQPQQTTSTPAQSPSVSLSAAQLRNGYANYARQVPAALNPATPTANPAQSPALATQTPASPPTSADAANIMRPASPATPVNIPQNLTPQTVEQLLVRAEAQPLPQGYMTAVVMGKEPGGALIVQTRLGMFTLPQIQADAAQQQPGSVLTWQVRAVQIPQTTEALPITGSSSLLATATQMTAEWSALNELITVLQTMQGNAAAQQALQRIVPHIGSNMGAGLLFFMNVLRKGDVFEWLGRDIVDRLEQIGKGDLVQRLGNDLSAVRSLFVDQPPGNWQAMFFPVMVEKELHHAQMFMKQEAEDKKKGGSGTRFIVELDLSNLGPMQIDGFIKKRENLTQFDLVMRTMAELPDTLKTDIYAIFDNAQKIANFNGSLHFRLVSEFPVLPLEEMHEAAQGKNSGSIMA